MFVCVPRSLRVSSSLIQRAAFESCSREIASEIKLSAPAPPELLISSLASFLQVGSQRPDSASATEAAPNKLHKRPKCSLASLWSFRSIANEHFKCWWSSLMVVKFPLEAKGRARAGGTWDGTTHKHSETSTFARGSRCSSSCVPSFGLLSSFGGGRFRVVE